MDSVPTYIHLHMVIKCNHNSFKTPGSCNFFYQLLHLITQLTNEVHVQTVSTNRCVGFTALIISKPAMSVGFYVWC